MSAFTKISFKNINGWIPESDADGVDINENVASDISVFRYKNGFLENDLDAESITLPSNVSTLISSSYNLKSIHKFSHSEQGDKTLYVLWKTSASDTDKLRIFIDNTEIEILDDRTLITSITEPSNINYNLVNDELKINLNSTGTAYEKSVILNLSLQYLEERIYNSTNNISRSAGWYLCPRWLGWQFNSILSSDASDDVEDFEDTSYLFSLSLEDFTRNNNDSYVGSYSAEITKDAYTLYDIRKLTVSLSNPESVVFYIKRTISGNETDSFGNPWYVLCQIRNSATDELFRNPLMQHMGNGWWRASFEINESGTNTYNIELPEWKNPTPVNVTYIDNISYVASSVDQTQTKSIIAVYNGQRSMIDSAYAVNEQIILDSNSLDWRIDRFEIYEKDSNDIWTLYGYIDIDDNFSWGEDYSLSEDTVFIWFNRANQDYDTSLDFAYNLPFNTRVDNQSLIYSEVSYKGRVYFVKEDFKVYQSHISGNGIVQPDSFPYSEDQGFGYFVVSRTRKNIALAVSTTDDLVVFTDNSFYVYQIQPSGSTVFRRLLMVSGSVGLSSRNSLAKNEEGNPATDGLMWIDDNGIYYYAGGVEPPINLLLPTHIEYWRDISSSIKSSSVGFYNQTRQEYTLYMSNNILLTYELPYKKFRKSEFSAISEYVGIEDNIQYFRNLNQLYKFVDNSYQISYITTHYNSGYTQDNYGRTYKEDELDDKILQELYVILGSGTDATAEIYITVYWDGHTYPTTFKVDATKQYWKIPMPILRFRRIKLKASVSNAKRVVIRDWGITLTSDSKEALGVNS